MLCFLNWCPKLYTEEGKLYPRHVHYTVLTEDKVWSTNIGTIEVTCKLSFETMEKIQNKRTYVIMNALSKEAYDENHVLIVFYAVTMNL